MVTTVKPWLRQIAVSACLAVALVLAIMPVPALAADPTGADTLIEDPGAPLDYVWIILASALVFIMQGGFAMLTAGLCRAKNVVNLMMKNLMDFAIGSLAFFAVGYALMFGASKGGLFGTTGWFLAGEEYDVGRYLLFLFQVMFAATAATIVAGAVAERLKVRAYFLYSIAICALIYPVYGHWVWGGGWLSTLPFGVGHVDFAGSGVVHAVGGFMGLAGALVLGPRIGKYDKTGKAHAIPGHSMTLAALGVFILWFGWYGFNAGSTLSALELRSAVIAVNTTLAASAGAVSSLIVIYQITKRLDVGMALNGAIAGLVGITAACAWVEAWAAVVIGGIAGAIVVVGVLFLDKIRVDDPVGAVSVHGLNGIWGLLAVGLFADGTYGLYTTEGPMVVGLFYGGGVEQLLAQAIGVVVAVAWAFLAGLALFKLLDVVLGGIRVPPQEEIEGLDIGEHGGKAYPNFTVVDELPYR
ncbi:MAG: ammonium transporter [Dehalococcoidia bacterium]|nr:ammonium transporter [Dehalococcoidia bacterium]